ncbi:MAG: hypothetical protein IT347_06995 [Candidatus Eisenbacteria bacterium]|nr:hypothetical protein [Candidatus Eisenbacteria bacterium]
MKKTAILTLAMLALGASLASAAGGLYLHFNGCTLDGGTSSATFACDVNTGSEVLFASVVIPENMPMFTATSAIVDATVDAAALPDWWLTAPGQCRANAVTMSFDPSLLATACGDIWQGSINLSVFQAQQFLHGPNTVRFNGGAAIPAGSEISLVADGTTELNVSRLNISHTKSTGAGSCAGCNVGVCLTLQECYLQQPAGFPVYRVTTPVNAVVALNSSPVQCQGATPTRNRTWGAVKGLYR